MTSTASLFNAPVLAELYRGFDQEGAPIIERVHHGIIAVVDGRGQMIFSHGDVNFFAHMRSCAKLFQILPLFEMGFFDDDEAQTKLALTPADLVLMMSSHAGEPLHTARVDELLKKLGLDHHALRCGIHAPYDTATFCELLRRQQKPNELHNNCSGKHLGMLIACLRQGFDRHSYEEPSHPLQVWIKRLIALVADINVNDMSFGIDGCSLPSLVMPLKNLALMYARLALWATTSTASTPAFVPRACRMMWDAIGAYPEYLAGNKRFDSVLIRASKGRIVSKGGADGIISLAIAPFERYPHGLGITIKIADGDPKQHIRPLVVKTILEGLDLWPQDSALLEFLPPTKNFRGLITGSARCRFKMTT